MSVPPIPIPSQETPEGALRAYFRRGVYPDESLKKSVLHILARRKVIAASQGDYAACSNIANAETDIKNHFRKALPSKSSRPQSEVRQRAPTEVRLNRVNHFYAKKLAAFKREARIEKTKLNQRQHDEMDQFAAHWNNPVNLTKYAKPSPQLLQLREIERKFVLLNDFDNAQLTKQQADALEQQETANAKEKSIASMKMALATLQAKHEREQFACRQKLQRQKQSLIQQYNDLVVPIEKRITTDAIRCKDGSPEVRSPFQSTMPIRDDESVVLPTPRTNRMRQEFRKKKSSRNLRIDGIDVAAVSTKPKRRAQ